MTMVLITLRHLLMLEGSGQFTVIVSPFEKAKPCMNVELWISVQKIKAV